MKKHSSTEIQSIHRHLHSHLPSEPALRIKALESLLVEKGLVDSKAIDAWIETFSEDVGPKRGAAVVAKAWTNAAFRSRLLADASTVINEFGFETATTAHLQVVENTSDIHNLIVCTLCSCYPLALLGLPPSWYKSAAYRSRAIQDPRSILLEFGVKLSTEVRVTVWDSTAEIRYLVLPQRPPSTEGWSEEKLAGIVTRNSMIGTERSLSVAERV